MIAQPRGRSRRQNCHAPRKRGNVRLLAARCVRGFARTFSLENKGSRECRVHAAPAVSCAKAHGKTHTSIQVQSEHSGIPCAMALRLMPRSPRRRIRLASVVGELAVHESPVGLRKPPHNLAPATGVRTTRFCRTLQRRSSCAPLFTHGEMPPCEHVSRPTLPRPPHPIPTSVTIAIRPSWRG
jgi:hypothetical protein